MNTKTDAKTDKTTDTKTTSAKKADKAEQKAAFDIVLYGATSFVGKIMVEYLVSLEQSDFTWAIAARDESKLKALKQKHDIDHITHFVADASDTDALEAMCAQTRLIITTVGPYAHYGEPLLACCAKNGTDYCDLTGEPQWIKAMLDKYEDDAKASGARIINSAGFDSIPSDLGVYLSQKLAIEKTGSPAQQIKMRVRKIKGAASGGTVASLLNVLKEAGEDKSLRKKLANPYLLCPEDHPFSLRQTNHTKAEHDKDLGMWTMPFVMAAINERIVHRSNALLDNKYGKQFRYDEAMSAKKGSTAWITALGLGAFVAAASVSPIRNLLSKYVLPKPGEGPSEQDQLDGMFDMRFYAMLNNGEVQTVQVLGDRDPGYGSTAKMLTQAALCLAKDVPDLAGGFYTPAAALAEPLMTRLKEHAGVEVKAI